MAFATLANTIGIGMFMVVSVLFFTQIVGLAPGPIRIGLTIAGLCGLLVVSGAVFSLVTLVSNWWSFVLVMCVATSLDRGSAAVGHDRLEHARA